MPSLLEALREAPDLRSKKTRFKIGSVPAIVDQKGKRPVQLLGLTCGHWGGAEIRNHWRKDACWREDATRTRNVTALANLALLRSVLLRLCPAHWPNLSLPRAF